MDQEQLAHLFWSRVRKTDGCWLWEGAWTKGAGADDEARYGVFSRGARGTGVPAHRFSWELANGTIPVGGHVLHRCDVPLCVRPDHLFLGDQLANMRDMAAKGRQALQAHPERAARGDRHGTHTRPETVTRGAAVHTARLTEADVLTIRARRAAGETLATLAAAYGVTAGNVARAASGETWGHLPGAVPKSGYPSGDRHYRRRS